MPPRGALSLAFLLPYSFCYVASEYNKGRNETSQPYTITRPHIRLVFISARLQTAAYIWQTYDFFLIMKCLHAADIQTLHTDLNK